MEIELKYKIPAMAIAEDIWKDDIFSDIEEDGSREELYLDAKYFDTSRCDLAKNEIAYRVRTEGERIVAALKWKGHSEGGLHTREEINVPVMDDEPDISVFHESEIGRQLAEIVGDETLECFMETKFNRRRFRIDTGTSIFEVSVDVGKIVTKYGESPISEVEIELFSGETKEMIGIGRKLRDQYDLEAENESKYARGIELIRDNMGDESRNISEVW